MDAWYDAQDGGIPPSHGHVQSLDSWQNDSYWGDNQRNVSARQSTDLQPTWNGVPADGSAIEPEVGDRPLKRWLQDHGSGEQQNPPVWNNQVSALPI